MAFDAAKPSGHAVCDGLDSGRVMDALFGTGSLAIGGFEMQASLDFVGQDDLKECLHCIETISCESCRGNKLLAG